MIQFLDDEYIKAEDLKCSTHRDKTAIGRISGDVNCYYCGNTVNICSECLDEIEEDILSYDRTYIISA